MRGDRDKIAGMSLRLIACVLAVVPGISFALSLGEASGRAVLGQPLMVRIPLDGADRPSLRADCIKLLPVPGELPENRIASALLRLEGSGLVVSSPLAISQPLMSFRIRVDCGWNLTKDYQLLPEPPATRSAPPAPVLAEVAPPSAPAPTPREAAPRVTADLDFGVDQPTTLRLMSRQRYPTDSAARVAFIRRVAAANPDLFPSIRGAYDQPLPAGTRLHIPPVPPRAARDEAPPPQAAPKARKAAPPKPAAKGRLIIGPDALPARSNEALAADLDRLVEIANDQIRIQITMAERLARMEADVEQAKRAFAAQQATNQRLEAELRELREEQRRSSYIQLVMAILLGGAGVAAFLFWRGQVRAREKAELNVAFVAPAPQPARPATPPKAELPSLFDDLLPPK